MTFKAAPLNLKKLFKQEPAFWILPRPDRSIRRKTKLGFI